MNARLRGGVAPAYLLLCLLLGGSVQGMWANALLQLLGIAILAWAALTPQPQPLDRAARRLLLCLGAGVVLLLIQLVPLPSAVSLGLPGRGFVRGGLALLGVTPNWMPLSLASYDTMQAGLALIPPAAMLAAMLRLRPPSPLIMVAALLAGTIAGVLLGALQMASPDGATSPFYLFAETNIGVAVGFFANANHMATLLVISIPFLAAPVGAARPPAQTVQRYSATLMLAAGALLVVIIGIILNGSLAGFGLAVPVVVASTLLLVGPKSRARGWIGAGAGVGLLVVLGLLMSTPVWKSPTRADANTSVVSRADMLRTTIKATREFLPLGSGIGTFQRVYAVAEDHQNFNASEYVNHAHDDYAEIALETGLPGIVILILFFACWAVGAVRAWRSDAGPYARAATIASAAILAHSLVDFPLRTAAIGACFAMCLAMMFGYRRVPTSDPADLWPTRHVVLR